MNSCPTRCAWLIRASTACAAPTCGVGEGVAGLGGTEAGTLGGVDGEAGTTEWGLGRVATGLRTEVAPDDGATDGAADGVVAPLVGRGRLPVTCPLQPALVSTSTTSSRIIQGRLTRPNVPTNRAVPHRPARAMASGTAC